MGPRCTLCRDDGMDKRATRWSEDFGPICWRHAEEYGCVENVTGDMVRAGREED